MHASLRIALLLTAIATSACGGHHACPGFSADAFDIVVEDAITHRSLCNAAIFVIGDGATYTPTKTPGEEGCLYQLYGAPSGSYSIRAIAPGYSEADATGSVERDDCRLVGRGQNVTLDMEPRDAG